MDPNKWAINACYTAICIYSLKSKMQQNQIKSKSYGQAKQLNLFFDKDSVKSFDILYKELQIIKMDYSIHVPGWLQKWLNLITAPGSVSNEPGSVTWLATKYLKTVSWRNHTEKLTTWWPQNISFWPKINIPPSYFTILMLNCLKNTLKLQFDSYVTAVRFLT